MKHGVLKNNKQATKGQAIVEYILLLALVVVAISALMSGFRQPLQSLWIKMIQEITAACPTCPPVN